jgi:thiamine biosynthesis protein ThiS
VKITLNGRDKQTDSKTIDELLDEFEQKKAAIVVEQNLNILNKDDYINTPVNEGDKIEFIRFMGGG